jgi:hypothetical protein
VLLDDFIELAYVGVFELAIGVVPPVVLLVR